MKLTDQQKAICERVVNVFESGKPDGDYGALVIFADGPHRMRQVTYGRAQTTEYGNLEELVEMYLNSGGIYSAQLKPYLAKIGVTPLTGDATFKQLLKDAGKKDPVMRQVQDEFFEKRYLMPALDWAESHGFNLALSALVIYDSQVHSGGIPSFLRKRFKEKSPTTAATKKPGLNNMLMCAAIGWQPTATPSCTKRSAEWTALRMKSPEIIGISPNCRSTHMVWQWTD